MIRLLYFPLTAILVTLAVMLQNVWLYAATGVAVAAGLVVLGAAAWRRYQDEQSSSSAGHLSPQPTLNELGISDIRPKPSQPSTARPVERKKTTPDVTNDHASDELSREPSPASSRDAKSRVSTSDQVAREASHQAATGKSPSNGSLYHSFTTDRPLSFPISDLMGKFLRLVQTSMHAHTVCLLGVHAEVGNESFTVEAAISKSPHLERGDPTVLDNHFLQNVSSNDPVTILVTEDGTSAIGELDYYSETVAVNHVAVAPVQVSNEMVGYLLADRTPAEAPIQTVYYTLLAEFAQLLGTILHAKMEDRPRREIIAEEIEKTATSDHSLALALVHPDNAESILQDGLKAVAQTEYLLMQTLKEITPNGRVERFGELIYGAFCYDANVSIDTWAQRVQNAFTQNGQGVSIGVAIYGERHETADDLRADAAEALRVAYEAGRNECVIVE